LTQNQTKGRSKNEGTRSFAASFRTVEGEGNERRRILSFSSETPVQRWFGAEILDHSPGAIDMSRLEEIGVVLFNHHRDRVLGKIHRAWVEDGRGCAEIEFDDDAETEVVFQKVANETLRTTSVGYRVDAFETVKTGSTSTDGRFAGPCDVARKWTPYEISIVSVPADATVGVGREMDVIGGAPTLETYEKQIQVNKNYVGG